MAKKPEKYSNIRKRVGKQLIDRYHNWKRSLGCCFCGENEPICLELHHKDPSTKDIQPNKLRTLSWERIQKESVKCIMVCSNYHKKIHAGLLDDSDKPLITFSS
ncbi:MAG: hypothetical protein EO766_11875 [Hydrotalea sp. AMD]|uniref:hypothetical protein n=1 Tax=Hydrotalea sp. AMD TaxID=2501297 RepID=UPI00102728B0|nr:hypothetical protein [Hydrotalea sp. AMD]RWZ87219.1 MAG: hypothetical protein EO766_11875 [Hydrotalea sp. AMD]